MSPRPSREQAAAAFWQRVAELGARPAPGAVYVNSNTPVALVCAAGHSCAPRPVNARRWGLCRTCAGRDSTTAQEAFWARVTALGGRPAPGAVYCGANIAVRLICSVGHACAPRPASLQQGQSLCRTCAGRDPAAAAARFWARVRELGGKPAPGAIYVDSHTPVALICRVGHPCAPRPAGLRAGQGMCRVCAGRDPQTTATRFWARIAELGATPAPGAAYRGNHTPVPLVCSAGHDCAPTPAHIQRGQGLCRACAGTDPKAAEESFWGRVAALGGTPAPGAVYRGNQTPVALICAAGHACAPRPASVQQGAGLCRTCAGKDPAATEAAFWAQVTASGATPAADAVYVDNRTPVPLICAAGHACAPRPGTLLRGSNPCRTCARRDPRAAEATFWERVAALGAVAAAGATYVNALTPVPLVCAAGHHCAPTPATLQQGRGPCRTCAGVDPAAAEAAFWARVDALGAQPAPGAVYAGNKTPVSLICVNGHACAPTPTSLQRGQGPCRTCAGVDPKAAEAAFWDRVAELGAVAAPGAVYVDTKTPVSLICAAGHACAPMPTSLSRGQGPCGQCVVVFDRIYLLVHPEARAVKIGIASRDARVRDHLGRGYRLVAQWTGLPHKAAVGTERAVLERWRDAGVEPVAAAPRDGRTETAPEAQLSSTRALLSALLGAPDLPLVSVP